MSFHTIASLTRRKFLAGSAAVAAVAFAREAHAQTASGPFQLPALGYPFNALEPHIDARTMEIHHDRHHAAYVANLNNAVKDHSNIASMPLQDILAKLAEMPEAIRTMLRNNGGGTPIIRCSGRSWAPAAVSRRAMSPQRSPAISAACRSCRTTSTPRGCACSARAGHS